MNTNQIFIKLVEHAMPGYIIGLERTPGAQQRFVSHIYRGTFADPGDPMCPKGWNRDGGESYSIWRNNLGRDICKNCLRAVEKETSL
jgi:hypothetical protein